MDHPTRRELSSEDPVEGRPEEPERKRPAYRQPEPDPFPGYGEPSPDVRDSPPNVPRRDRAPTGNTTP